MIDTKKKIKLNSIDNIKKIFDKESAWKRWRHINIMLGLSKYQLNINNANKNKFEEGRQRAIQEVSSWSKEEMRSMQMLFPERNDWRIHGK